LIVTPPPVDVPGAACVGRHAGDTIPKLARLVHDGVEELLLLLRVVATELTDPCLA